jgi:hypothetical protein
MTQPTPSPTQRVEQTITDLRRVTPDTYNVALQLATELVALPQWVDRGAHGGGGWVKMGLGGWRTTIGGGVQTLDTQEIIYIVHTGYGVLKPDKTGSNPSRWL